MVKTDEHIFQGMQQDTSISKADGKYLFSANNIRITPREDNDGFTITNEKEESSVTLKDSNDNTVTIDGTFLGGVVLNQYYIAFSTDGIYRIDFSGNTPVVTRLYQNGYPGQNDENYNPLTPDNPLNLSKSIEAIAIYENKDVQKVYWLDGINQPRMIHITKEYPNYNDYKKFDFVQELTLNEEISVEKVFDASGMLPAGVIQYAFSYYNKYSQESNIFYTTGLHYVSYKDRGGSAEDICKCGFKITVTNLDPRFEYIRIYSIHRTSLDAVPITKLVTDIHYDAINATPTVTYYDYGTTGEDIDSTRLLYVGGENIIANTMTHKDGTLFLGNIKVNRDSSINYNVDSIDITQGMRPIELDWDGIGSFYAYGTTINKEQSASFKTGENYRLGFQLQHKNGKWSQPIFLKDFTLGRGDGKNPTIGDWTESGATTPNILQVPKLTYTISKTGFDDENYPEGYVKARPVIVLPSYSDRKILLQGVLCPTVFNYKNRMNNAPFFQSSWFFRPIDNWQGTQNPDSTCLDKLMFEQWHAVGRSEVQGAEGIITIPAEMDNLTVKTVERSTSYTEKYSECFFVDQQFLTMHSPDIEFDTAIQSIKDENWNLDIIGACLVSGSSSDIMVQTSTPTFGNNSRGFVHNSFTVKSENNSADYTMTHAIYEDLVINSNGEQYGENNEHLTDYKIYTWHRQGSLNTDINRTEGNGKRTAVLSRKTISNEKFCWKTVWTTLEGTVSPFQMHITPIQIFNSNEISLLKLSGSLTGLKSPSPVYYGNVDYIVSYPEGYNINDITNTPVIINNNNNKAVSKEPVRIKYKSTPHIVFGFKSTSDILPRAAGYNKINSDIAEYIPNWINIIDPDNPGTSAVLFDGLHDYTSDGAPVITIGGQDEPLKGPIILWRSGSPQPDILDNDFKEVEGDGYTSYQTFRTLWGINDISIYTLVDAGTGSNNLICGWDDTTHMLYVYQGVLNGANSEILFNSALDSGDFQTLMTNHTVYWKFNGTVPYNSYTGYYRYDVYGDTVKMTFVQPVDPDAPQFTINQKDIDSEGVPVGGVSRGLAGKTSGYSFFYIADLSRDYGTEGEQAFEERVFGGQSEEALLQNLWIPAGKPVDINSNGGTTIEFIWGDTWYQRYDCLKTYPFTHEDENSVVDILSFLCETRVNIDGRYDRNRGQQNNLTITPQNFNLLNPVYSQKNNYFNYRQIEEGPLEMNNTIYWSAEKHYGEDVDSWTNVTMVSVMDLDGDKGAITALRTYNSNLYGFQEHAIARVLFNSRVQIPVTDGVPIEISNSYKVDGKIYLSETTGCQQKSSICITEDGIYFADMNKGELNILTQQGIQNLSKKLGFSSWLYGFKNGTSFLIDNDDDNRISTFYDKSNRDVYFKVKKTVTSITTNTILGYSEILGQFISFYPMYDTTLDLFNIGNDVYRFAKETTSSSLKHLFKGSGYQQNFMIEFISNPEFTTDKIFDNIEFRADANGLGTPNNNENNVFPFSEIKVYNEYQDTDTESLPAEYVSNRISKNLQKKFRIWRVQIPRDKNNRNRIRNTWCKIKLSRTTAPTDSIKYKYRIHDVNVKYFQ